MGGFVEGVPMIIGVVLGVVFVGIFLLVGYTIAAKYIGFGSHVVKKTETFEYEDDALAKLRDAEKQAKRPKHAEAKRTDPPAIEDVKKLTITTETQTGKTFWDWLTVVT